MAALVKLGSSLASKGNNLVKNVTPRLNTFWGYAKVELRPPTPADFPQISKGFNNLITGATTGRWQQVTIKEATVNTLVAFEVAMWFFVGECLGKRSIVGYQIPGAVHFDTEF